MVGRSRRCTEAEWARFEKELQLHRRTFSVVGAGFDVDELDVHVGGGILAGAVAFRLFLFLVFLVPCLRPLHPAGLGGEGGQPERRSCSSSVPPLPR